MRKIKALLIAAVFTAIGASAFAADATVTFVSGKVEVQRGGKWVALQKGDTVSKNETISTGFQSEAKIKILESVMYLGPVTRITLEELSSTEDKIAYSRQFYNDAVQMYNTQVLTFPKNIIAGMFGFTQKKFFEVTDQTQREAVKVQF